MYSSLLDSEDPESSIYKLSFKLLSIILSICDNIINILRLNYCFNFKALVLESCSIYF